jgi:hypothetical protein
VAAAGLKFAYKGWTASFVDDLACDADTRTWIVPLGRAGYLARGALFVMVGGFLVAAAVQADAREAKGLAGALETLQQQPYGWVLLAAAAAGLFAFGVFMLAVARYRRIDAPRPQKVKRKLKKKTRAVLDTGR